MFRLKVKEKNEGRGDSDGERGSEK